MRVNSIVIPSGQTVDVIDSDENPAIAGAVLLHGSGTSERVSLRAFGVALATRGIMVVIPDWHPATPIDSVGPALTFASDVFDRAGISLERRTVVGYSAGGRVALDFTLNRKTQFSRCVAIATSTFEPSKVDPSEVQAHSAQVLLVHGDADTVRPPSQSERLCIDLAAVGVDAQTVVIAGGTHASVVCATFEPSLELSNPATQFSPSMRQAVKAVTQFVLN